MLKELAIECRKYLYELTFTDKSILSTWNKQQFGNEIWVNKAGITMRTATIKHGEYHGWSYSNILYLHKSVMYRKGLQHGPVKLFNPEHTRLSAEYIMKNNEQNGPFVSYHANGNIFELINYKHNRIDGLYVTYDHSGHLINEITYVDGFKCGLYTSYNSDGSIALKRRYISDEDFVTF